MQLYRQDDPRVAYFSMEVGLEPAMPTYSGGLGVLAGDTLRAAADVRMPLIGVSLLHRKGYFRQRIDAEGNQSEHPADWEPENFLEPRPDVVAVSINGRDVFVRAWLYRVHGVAGHDVPVILLDTALPENHPDDQALTDYLYGGDREYRLRQEVLLGVGGVAMLQALGFESVDTFHMNEGHSALLTLAMLEEEAGGRDPALVASADREAVRRRCVFTTHTPVAAGHDVFDEDVVVRVLGEERAESLRRIGVLTGGALNMTHLALAFSRYVNGVALRHGEVSRVMFPEFSISSITNGVHAGTWTSPAFAELYDRYIPEWRRDNSYLRNAVGIPLDEIWEAHTRAKADLLAEIEWRTGRTLAPDVLTIGFARRATAYKRAELLFSDVERLRAMTEGGLRLQLVYAGKAHRHDEAGKQGIRRIHEAAEALKDVVDIVYLEDYDMALGRLLCAGVDIWLNTPRKPLEASGTSGMKAALNGVPSLSVLDGWWIEGHIEGITGWAIGDSAEPVSDDAAEAASLYAKLEGVVAPLFYGNRDGFAHVMRCAAAVNGSFFNAERMVRQYAQHAYEAVAEFPRLPIPAGAPR